MSDMNRVPDGGATSPVTRLAGPTSYGSYLSDPTPVPPRSLGAALRVVRDGGRLFVATYTRLTIITQDTIVKWASVPGHPLLREEGDGYRMRSGKGSVFLRPGQLQAQVNELVRR